jgi:ABC-type branched-subunit amino acid transport system substrate-binding protein
MQMTRWRRAAAMLSVVALFAVACGDNAGETTTESPTEADAGATDADTTDADATEADADATEADADATDDAAAPGDIQFDTGVTEEACPNAVNADNGCIYLGILSDLTEGPFAALGVPLTEAQRDFWNRVNTDGGIAGFDVDVDTYTRDTRFDPQEHSSAYRQIEPNILALHQSLGTEPTEAILRDMDDDNVIASPATWWSGWGFEEQDRGLILEIGYSYCIESMIAMDYVTANIAEPASVMAVGYPGDFGGDSAAGVEAWAEAAGVEFLGFVETAPNAIVGSQDAAISQIVSGAPDAVMLAVGPAETAEIVGGSAAQGFEGQFMGSVPTWNPALLQTPAAPALEAMYLHVGFAENFDGESEAHDKLREARNGEPPVNDAYTYGWIQSYPILRALEAAAANGDLTREGLRSVVDGLTVDYEGALPDQVYGGDPSENVQREATISRPDGESPLGYSTVEAGYTGPIASEYDYAGPCSG